jgi:hypothetical protein
VRARPGTIRDADGDTPTLAYRWFQDGAEVSGVRNSVIPTTSSTAPGTQYEVELVVSDDDGGSSTPVRAGPAVILSDTTRWRQIWPDRGRIAAAIVDERNERVILAAVPYHEPDAQWWEYDLTSGRFAQLFPTGTGPADVLYPLMLADPSGERVWIVGGLNGANGSRVASLDVRQRGSEAFADLALAGDLPGPYLQTATSLGVIDAEMNRIVMLGVEDSAAGPSIFSIDLGNGTVTREASNLVTTAFGGSWVRIPGRREVLVLGGGDPGAADFVANNRIHRLSLDALDEGFLELPTTLPETVAFPSAVVDAERDRILYGNGMTTAGEARTGFYSVGYDGTSAEPYEIDGPRSSAGGIFGLLALDPARNRILMLPGAPGIFDGASFDLYAFDPASGASEAVHAWGVNAPPPLRQAMGSFIERRAVLYGGRDAFGTVYGDVWGAMLGFGSTFTEWTLDTVATGEETPGPRFGQRVDPNMGALRFFGGLTDSLGTYAESTYTWTFDGARWTQLAETAPPAPRTNAYFFSGCLSELTFVGGDPSIADPTLVAQATCNASSCDWEAVTTTDTPPSYISARTPPISNGVELFFPNDATTPLIYDICAHEWRTGSWDGTAHTALDYSVVSYNIMFGGRFTNDLYRIVPGAALGAYRAEAIVLGADSPTPSPRAEHAAVWDSDNNRMIVYGGLAATGSWGAADDVLGDVWELRIR